LRNTLNRTVHREATSLWWVRVVEEFFVLEKKLAPADREAPESEIDIPATTHSELAVEKDNERVASRWWSSLASDARADEEEAGDVDGAERCSTLADIIRAPEVINSRLPFGGSGAQRLSAAVRSSDDATENLGSGGHRVLGKVSQRDWYRKQQN